jgi:hypothetical protein
MQPQAHPQESPAQSSWTRSKAKKKAARKKTAKKAAAKKKATAKKAAKKTAARKKTAKKKATRQLSVAGLRRKVAELDRKVAGLSDDLDHLAITLGEHAAPRDLDADEEPVANPFQRFLDEATIARCLGQHVALHEELGVVAHAAELADVIAEVRAKGVPLAEIALHYISDTPF